MDVQFFWKTIFDTIVMHCGHHAFQSVFFDFDVQCRVRGSGMDVMFRDSFLENVVRVDDCFEF